MAPTVTRKNGIALYVQVKERILSDIRARLYKAGDKLPTERELSAELGVSRNTVSQAYHDLEADGVLVSVQGRGTFVTDQDDTVRLSNRRDLLKKVIDVALEEAIQLGFSLEEFVELSSAQAERKAASLTGAHVVFVECNREQVDYFSRKLEFGGVHITPIVLDDLKDPGKTERRLFEMADLVITTFFHREEVQALLGEGGEVLAIALDPELETIVQIARIPRSKRVGLVCRSENFAGKVQYALKQAGLDELNLLVTTIANPYDLADFVSQVDAVIVSPGRKREVETYCKRRQTIIEFNFKPDAASVNLLRAALADLPRPV